MMAMSLLIGSMLLSGCLDDGTGGQNDDDTVVLSLIGKLDAVNLTFNELTDLGSVAGVAKAQNRFGNWQGMGQYQGVRLSDLVDAMGGMEPGDALKVIADDRYSQEFTYYNVYPDADWLAYQGEFMVAYAFNGTEYGGWDDGLKLVCLPEDGEYSQQDCNWTSAVGQGYNLNPSASARWVRNVAELEVLPGEADWNVTLTGEARKTLSGTEYAMFKNWFGTSVTDYKNRTWEGVPIHHFIGLVDGGEARGEGAFNLDLDIQGGDIGYDGDAGNGYEVRIHAGDGYEKYFSKRSVEEDVVLLADLQDGNDLGEDAPLKVVVPSFSGKYWVSMIDEVELMPGWPLELQGDVNETVLYHEILKMDAVEGVAYANPVSYPGVDIKGPWRYKGVPLSGLVEHVFNTTFDYSVEVVAVDDYPLTLMKEQVEGNMTVYDLDKNDLGVHKVETILAYEMDGERWFDGGPLRLVFVNETGAVTDYAKYVKWVSAVKVRESVQDWNLNVSIDVAGLRENVTISREAFEHAATEGAHLTSVEVGGSVYEGIPLWILVSMVDGADTYVGGVFDHYGFNDTLATQNYNVTVTAMDGWSKDIASEMMARNDSLIVAYKKNGVRLSGDQWPLRLVGPDLSSVLSIRQVASLHIHPGVWVV